MNNFASMLTYLKKNSVPLQSVVSIFPRNALEYNNFNLWIWLEFWYIYSILMHCWLWVKFYLKLIKVLSDFQVMPWLQVCKWKGRLFMWIRKQKRRTSGISLKTSGRKCNAMTIKIILHCFLKAYHRYRLSKCKGFPKHVFLCSSGMGIIPFDSLFGL